MNKNKKNSTPFIKCSDSATIENLKKVGFQVVNESNGIVTFINDITKPITFDSAKIAYTNILNMDNA